MLNNVISKLHVMYTLTALYCYERQNPDKRGVISHNSARTETVVCLELVDGEICTVSV